MLRASMVRAAAQAKGEMERVVMGWEKAAAEAMTTAMAGHMAAYLYEETKFFFELPLLFASLGDPRPAQRQQQAATVLKVLDQPEAERPQHWDAFGFLTTHLEDVRVLDNTGSLAPALQQQLQNVFAAMPVSNAFAETCLKTLDCIGAPNMAEDLMEAYVRFIVNKPWTYAQVDDAALAGHRARMRQWREKQQQQQAQAGSATVDHKMLRAQRLEKKQQGQLQVEVDAPSAEAMVAAGQAADEGKAAAAEQKRKREAREEQHRRARATIGWTARKNPTANQYKAWLLEQGIKLGAGASLELIFDTIQQHQDEQQQEQQSSDKGGQQAQPPPQQQKQRHQRQQQGKARPAQASPSVSQKKPAKKAKAKNPGA